MKKITYKSSGVDIDKANSFVKGIQVNMSRTLSAHVLKRRGAFGALFGLDSKRYKDPVLVSSTDGVGTKLLIAIRAGQHDSVGIDLVAMNVNDILCAGARPLFFLDYIACGKLDPKVMRAVVHGIAQGCQQAGCALIGGETAEMPGMYAVKDYDLAGFAVGVVEKKCLLDGSAIKKGDRVLGLASSGIHSNGYSLVRKVLSAQQQKKMAKELLRPTRIYVKPVLRALEKFDIHGMAHNTGGAFYDKVPKVLPKGLSFSLHTSSWPVPKIFQIIQKKGKITKYEMYRTFNMGIGFIMVVKPHQADKVITFMKKQKIPCYDIGCVIKNKKKMILK